MNGQTIVVLFIVAFGLLIAALIYRLRRGRDNRDAATAVGLLNPVSANEETEPLPLQELGPEPERLGSGVSVTILSLAEAEALLLGELAAIKMAMTEILQRFGKADFDDIPARISRVGLLIEEGSYEDAQRMLWPMALIFRHCPGFDDRRGAMVGNFSLQIHDTGDGSAPPLLNTADRDGSPAARYLAMRVAAGLIKEGIADGGNADDPEVADIRHFRFICRFEVGGIHSRLRALRYHAFSMRLWDSGDERLYDLVYTYLADYLYSCKAQPLAFYQNQDVDSAVAIVVPRWDDFEATETIDSKQAVLAFLRLLMARTVYKLEKQQAPETVSPADGELIERLIEEAGLKSDLPPVPRYLIENIVRDVTGVELVNFSQLPYGKSIEDALQLVQVSEQQPATSAEGSEPAAPVWRALKAEELAAVGTELSKYELLETPAV